VKETPKMFAMLRGMMVFDFKCLVNDKVWIKYIKSKRVNWIYIREVQADSSYQTLVFKYDSI
jgi:hypothetical protein